MAYKITYTISQQTHFRTMSRGIFYDKESAMKVYEKYVNSERAGKVYFCEVNSVCDTEDSLEPDEVTVLFRYINQALIDQVEIVKEFHEIYPDEPLEKYDIGTMKVLTRLYVESEEKLKELVARVTQYGGMI